jgi:hypothetical protein
MLILFFLLKYVFTKYKIRIWSKKNKGAKEKMKKFKKVFYIIMVILLMMIAFFTGLLLNNNSVNNIKQAEVTATSQLTETTSNNGYITTAEHLRESSEAENAILDEPIIVTYNLNTSASTSYQAKQATYTTTCDLNRLIISSTYSGSYYYGYIIYVNDEAVSSSRRKSCFKKYC